MARLIDSDVLIGLERRGRSVAEALEALSGEPAALASITASELLFGVHRAENGRRRQERERWVDGILGAMPVFSFDARVARLHAQIWAELAAAGQMIGAHDLIIAATARVHGYAVLTYNLREFGHVPGLDVQRPPW